MKYFPLMAALVTVAGLPAAARDVWDDVGVWDFGWTADGTVAIAPDTDAGALYAARLGFSAERVLDNGVLLGAVGGVEFQKDHPQRAGFSGIVTVPPAGSPSRAGAFSGLGQSSGVEDETGRGSLETAYLYAQGGYGEVRLGRDTGVAKRFSEGSPSIFRTLSLSAPRLDPTGGAIVRTDHDLTGPSAKVSLATPRIVGLRGGFSYTPDAGTRGLDRDPARIQPDVPAIAIGDAAEAALSFSHLFRSSGLKVRASAACSRADVDAAPTSPVDFQTLKTCSAGGVVEFDKVEAGASWLGSNNGVDGRPGDYEAWTFGAKTSAFGLDWGAEYGRSTDDSVGVEGESWRAGVAVPVDEHINLAVAYVRDRLSGQQISRNSTLGGDGIVIEITLSR